MASASKYGATMSLCRPKPIPLYRPAQVSSVMTVLYRKSALPPPPYSSGTAMPRNPCLPASSHTPRSTILVFSHSS
ncbi:Uncharacterised protein [Mycobacterium tuberculosis]|nr:Uncharacterised protein [Mycobacterium tuberculosis]